VVGYTTPAVGDIGGASLRIRLTRDGQTPESGGYVLAIRLNGSRQWLPAIAGIPGANGLDREGRSRVGYAELMVLARPVLAMRPGGDEVLDCKTALDVTFLPDHTLQRAYPLGSGAEVRLVHKATDFFLGVNAGRWLGIRMAQICEDYQTQERAERQTRLELLEIPVTAEEGVPASDLGDWTAFLQDSGLQLEAVFEEPPADQALMFEHMGQSGNGGISGQTILRSREGFD
jgi:hypothetical protein